MATGPQRARLDRALNGAHDAQIERHAREWDRCQQILQQIGMSLMTASPEVKERIGGRTGPVVDAAFQRSAQHMGDKAAQLFSGAKALRDAADAITAGKTEQAALAAHPLSEPPPYRRPAGQPTKADLHDEAQSRQAHQAYQAAFAHQEERARVQADRMDRVFEHSAATMQKIHGEPDPQPTGTSGGAGGGGGGAGGSVPSGGGQSGPRHVDQAAPTGHHHPGPTVHGDPGPDDVPAPPGTVTGDPGVGAPQGGGPVDPAGLPASGVLGTSGAAGATGVSAGGVSAGTGAGLAGAAAGGVAGGLLGTGVTAGGIRGGAVAPLVSNGGTAASGVRGIGATARTGVTGALGSRSGGVGAVSSGSGSRSTGSGARSGASARAGGTSAAGRRGSTSGSRGAAGGRGAGAAASGRGGRGKDDEKRRTRDVFDTGDEWVDDEDTVPGILD